MNQQYLKRNEILENIVYGFHMMMVIEASYLPGAHISQKLSE